MLILIFILHTRTYFQTMAFSEVLYLARPLAKLVRTSDVFGGTGMRTYVRAQRSGQSDAEDSHMVKSVTSTEFLLMCKRFL